MSKLLITVFAVAVGLSAVSKAQVPEVQIFFDTGLQIAFADCPTAPVGTVFDEIYVVANNFNMMMNAIEYRIEYPTILFFAGDYVIDSGASVTGTSPDGISITFSTPQDAFGQFVIQRVSFIWMCDYCGYAILDTPVRVRPHPSSGKVRAVRWPDLEFVEAIGQTAWICFAGVPVHETNWGRVKALYR